jgi:membrane-bound inhibitor of C-type lysozyme
MLKQAAPLLLATLLGACASQPAPSASWNRWVCDSGVEVLWRFADGDREQVELRLGGDASVHRLTREPSGSGALYGDGRLSFHSKGEEGLVYWTANDDLIGRGCKAP